MKVDVITLHHVRNFGSLLQTYATQEIIKKFGHEVEIIDFIPNGLTLLCRIRTIKRKGGILQRFVRKCGACIVLSKAQISMLRFLKNNIQLTDKQYHTYSELKCDPPKADIYLVGSDQVWNTQNPNLPEDIEAYYLEFAPIDSKRISYASSIGKDGFKQEEGKRVFEHLSKFNAISVREKQAVTILSGIGVKDVVHVLDPTMLLNMTDWRALFGSCKHKKAYILVYNLNHNDKIKKYALQLSKKKNLPVINIVAAFDFIPGAKNLLHCNAVKFLNLVSNAEYVVTDSFHGTAFSINFNKQFVTFPAPKYNSRILSLLEMFGLNDRFMDNDNNPLKIDVINYDEINHKIEVEREKSMRYLEKVLL